MVVVGNRFGLKSVGAEYYPAIKKLMKLNQFVGLVGGKPNFAYYFCGFIEKAVEDADPLNQLVFLDPHIVRQNGDPLSCLEPRTLHMS